MTHRLKTAAMVTVLTLLLTLAVTVQATNLTKAFDVCIEKARSNVGVINCTDDEIKRQDERLNKTYAALRSDIDPARRPALLQAQRAWIQFRDSNCDFYLDPNGGSIAPILATGCLMRMTADRADELIQLLPRGSQ